MELQHIIIKNSDNRNHANFYCNKTTLDIPPSQKRVLGITLHDCRFWLKKIVN